jgi:hypothetical protein
VIWTLPADLAGRFRSEARQSRRNTYLALRRLYALSGGQSRRAVRGLFRLARPARPVLDASGEMVVNELRESGVARVPGYLSPARSARIRSFLEGCRTSDRGRVRQDYRSEDLLENPDIRELIADPYIRDLAAAYLGCTPVFTHLAAWWSHHDPNASSQELSEAAQLFHYDYDWPAFVKFFIYLTGVGPENGPFTYVAGTHEHKRHWGDGRREDDYIAKSYPNRIRAMTGHAGDMIIADTVGYHKGERVREGSRLMLQLEFAVSRIGASFQYPQLPAKHRPDASLTFDAFCA